MQRERKHQRRQRRKEKSSRRKRRQRPDYRKTWLDCQRQFLTSWFWRVAHQAAGPYQSVRWKLLPLLSVALMMLFCRGPAKDRFEEARELYTCMYANRRRPGKTQEGFLGALARLPRRALKAMRPVVRERVAKVLDRQWQFAGWVPLGVDGSRLALPRYAGLERRFGTSGTGDFPHLWVTGVVHLPTGVPWSWRLGRSDSSERHHLMHLAPTLPERALVVTDAGFSGYDLWNTIAQQGRHFLIRLSSKVLLYADYEVKTDFEEGCAYLWPKRHPEKKPLQVRIVRLPAKGKVKNDVWLATNVLSSEELSRKTISTLYRQRWEHEVFYRSYKCTLSKAKLSSRTTKQVVREAEIALIGVQLFLAQGAWAMGRKKSSGRVSCAEALRQLRREWRFLLKHGRLQLCYLARMGDAEREDRPNRTSAKNYREWPRKRKKEKQPGPPQITQVIPELKARLAKELQAA